jgi:hypothetical protein
MQIDFPPYNLDLPPLRQGVLSSEGKIRTEKIETPSTEFYLIQIFPLSDVQLRTVFTDVQFEVIKKNLSAETLTKKEQVTLSRVRKKISKTKKKYDLLRNLYL